jgi:acyl carrier protein
MQTEQIYHGLTEVFQDVFENEALVLEPAMTPAEIPGWDSARYINLVVATESRFGIRFQPAELESLRTISDFALRIQHKLGRN